MNLNFLNDLTPLTSLWSGLVIGFTLGFLCMSIWMVCRMPDCCVSREDLAHRILTHIKLWRAVGTQVTEEVNITYLEGETGEIVIDKPIATSDLINRIEYFCQRELDHENNFGQTSTNG